MGSACACAAVTGAKGEAMTFTRASTGWCTKGNETTGIANGDLVECGNNLPRIGTGGTAGLGISVWEARTNYALRSAELGNAVWQKNAFGVATPTITDNQAVAPDGTTTAERVEIPATSGGASQYSQVYQATGRPGGGDPASGGCYFRGNGTSGTINVSSDSVRIDCAYVSTSWTRCIATDASDTSAIVSFGNQNQAAGNTAQDVFVWGCGFESGSSLGPYIDTDGTAATRVAELPYLTVPSTTITGSMAVTTVTEASGWPGGRAIELSDGATESALLYTYYASGVIFYGSVGGINTFVNAYGGEVRLHAYWTGSGATAFVNYGGAGDTAGSITIGTVDRVVLGSTYLGTAQLGGVIKKVCVDTDSTRCRR